jgi:hypothetical protein
MIEHLEGAGQSHFRVSHKLNTGLKPSILKLNYASHLSSLSRFPFFET